MPNKEEAKVPDVFFEWFEGPYNPGSPEDTRKNYERIGHLVACNGGKFEITGWGVVTTGHPFQSGLLQEEALELMQLGSFINGANLIDATIWPYATDKITRWIKNKLDEWEKKKRSKRVDGESE